jgi:hypothetical protein
LSARAWSAQPSIFLWAIRRGPFAKPRQVILTVPDELL